jgi:lysophospholipid acyltransferase (LPLAT)-like uncharacterized protein
MKLVQPWTIGPFALILSALLRWWLGTLNLRFSLEDAAADPRVASCRGIYLFWHETMLFPVSAHGMLRDFTVLVSQHRDGELIARILKMLGFKVVRGSTTRRSLSAIRGMMRQGQVSHLAVTPDGPLGPRRIVQPGAVYVASKTGMPIFPIGFAFRNCWRAGSWDRMALPKPWSRGVCVVGKPLVVPPDLSSEAIEEHRKRLQVEMDRVQACAEAGVERAEKALA